MKKVFCFGVFDGIHDGHIHMLTEAKSNGDYLVVALTQDHIVEQLKKRSTRNRLDQRMQELLATGIPDEVVPGDEAIGTWKTLQAVKPAVIALGYDQGKLLAALQLAIQTFDFQPEVVILQSHLPDILHSSLLFH